MRRGPRRKGEIDENQRDKQINKREEKKKNKPIN